MYISTRGDRQEFSAAAAIKAGIAPDGGLLVPEELPRINSEFLAELVPLNYHQRAIRILQLYLDDYSGKEIENCVMGAYGGQKYDHPDIAPLTLVNGNMSILELWHGPTSAFKDMALQLLPQLLSLALRKTDERNQIVILVATSGDTGKAALEGFRDVDQTKIIVFYPDQGVSEIQRLQMVTQEGSNVAVVAVKGNFDDTQTGVKNIFNNKNYGMELAERGFKFSSANSINWGRLLPQIVYYFSAYADMIKQNQLTPGQKLNFVVPTGNFGNILAGYYAKLMGLPINKLICASNSNNVLTDFLRTGIYNRKREFFKTLSPSMDILISSNLERLLYHITGGNTKLVAEWMGDLSAKTSYRVEDDYLKLIQETFWADWVDDIGTKETINKVFDTCKYLLDPHTAVAWRVYEKYRQDTADNTPTVIVSTASPFKFNNSVLGAIAGEKALAGKNEFAVLSELSALTGWKIPPALAEMESKPILHNVVCSSDEMPAVVDKML